MTRKTRKCVEMFLAGTQRMSQTALGLLGRHVCRHRYEERGTGGGGVQLCFPCANTDYTLQRCPAASSSSSSSSNGKISIFILLWTRSCHQTAWLRSTPGRHTGSQHAVSLQADLGSSQRTVRLLPPRL